LKIVCIPRIVAPPGRGVKGAAGAASAPSQRQLALFGDRAAGSDLVAVTARHGGRGVWAYDESFAHIRHPQASILPQAVYTPGEIITPSSRLRLDVLSLPPVEDLRQFDDRRTNPI
jgi:hypothetical protein